MRWEWRAKPIKRGKQRKTHKSETPIPLSLLISSSGGHGQTMQDIRHTSPPAQSRAVGPRGLLRGTRQEQQKYEKHIKDKSRKKGRTKAITTRRENRNTHASYLKRQLGMRPLHMAHMYMAAKTRQRKYTRDMGNHTEHHKIRQTMPDQ